jgi:non-canonical poly(A) RNA polymerase PAPD5/7
VRRGLFNRVYEVLANYKAGHLYCFGSFAAGLYLPNGDMDLVYVSHAFEQNGNPLYASKTMLHACLGKLRAAGIVRERTGIAITKAKVPIIKFVDDLTGIRVDISFENLTGVVANDTYEQWKREHPAMVYLIPVIKQFLLMRDLNEVFSGGIGGFSITCLVVSFLQHHPAIQSGNMNPERHLGELLVEFLDLYGNRFNMETTGITLNPPGYFPKVVGQIQTTASTNVPSTEARGRRPTAISGPSLIQTTKTTTYLEAHPGLARSQTSSGTHAARSRTACGTSSDRTLRPGRARASSDA